MRKPESGPMQPQNEIEGAMHDLQEIYDRLLKSGRPEAAKRVLNVIQEFITRLHSEGNFSKEDDQKMRAVLETLGKE